MKIERLGGVRGQFFQYSCYNQFVRVTQTLGCEGERRKHQQEREVDSPFFVGEFQG